MKIAIIGAGNVGSTTALRLTQENFGSIVLIDIVKGLAQGKSLDLEDARFLVHTHYCIEGSNDFTALKDSTVVVLTAGLARKPGMSREELRVKNAAITTEVSTAVKTYAPSAILIVVTNPLDLMTHVALKTTGFPCNRVLGMGVSLDASRFANLISAELHIPVTDIDAMVIGSHGEGMLPLARFSLVKGKPLSDIVSSSTVERLINNTVGRGAE
ncbi:MAG: malate dehydrogenase, partial [Candidatus Omnitrophica bacterium]|nr:malate dehydrogenase [Candidatus Omnitrophota bacterium]